MAGYQKINSKMVQVDLAQGRQVFSRRGAMLAYTGRVSFTPSVIGGQGIGGMIGRRMAGESVPLMVTEGQGSVMYGHGGLHVDVVELAGDTLCIEADRLLCYDGTLQAGTMFLGAQGGVRGVLRGAVTGQGLFTTMLSGHGGVAMLSHGGVIALQIRPDRPIVVDPQAYVAHRGQVQNALTTAVGWRDMVGRGSGEAFQLKLSGTGIVYVQASEREP
jgi:uncharacterized protein (AIM24 family)